MQDANETLAAPGEASETTGGAPGFATPASRCKLTLNKSKYYWALVVCTHCRNYTSCRSVFTCYSKVAHHREVMLVDGDAARDKVAILVEEQPGFPSTEGRNLGEIMDLDVGMIDAGMKCTVGCQDCTGLPLKECIDAGHVQQERSTQDLPLVPTRRAHAKLRPTSKEGVIDSRKTARSETEEVEKSKKRTRLSVPPRRTPATTRSRAKEEAASTPVGPSPRPSAKDFVTRSVTRDVTPLRSSTTSSTTHVVTPSTWHVGTPSAKPASTPLKRGATASATRVVTPSTGAIATPPQHDVPNFAAKPAVAPTPSTKFIVTPPARPAAMPSAEPAVTPRVNGLLTPSGEVVSALSPKPAVSPLRGPAVASSGSWSGMALTTTMIERKKYVLPKCIVVEGNSFVVVLGWQKQEFLVNGVPSRPGRMRCKLPWEGGVTLDNLTKTRAFRDAIWWEKTCTIHPLVAANVAREQSMVFGEAHPGSIVRVILCRRGRDGRAPVFATTKGEVQQHVIEEEARISQLMTRISENCPERPEACSASDVSRGSSSEGAVAAKDSHTCGAVPGPSSATSTGSAVHLSSTVNRNEPHKRQLEGSDGDIGTAVDDCSEKKRRRTGSSDSPIEDQNQDMDSFDSHDPVEGNGDGTPAVHASFKASPVSSENLKPTEACGQGTPTAPASVRPSPVRSENLNPLQTSGHDAATPSASGRVPPVCAESLKPAETNVLGTASLPVSVRAPPRCSESLKPPEVIRHDTATAPAVFQAPTVCAENLKHAEVDEHGSAAAPVVLQAPPPSPSKLAEANNHGSAAVPAALQASTVCAENLKHAEVDKHGPAATPAVLQAPPPSSSKLAEANNHGSAAVPAALQASPVCSENVKPAEANEHGTTFAPASVQTPPFSSTNTKPPEANGYGNATVAAFQASPASGEYMLVEINDGYSASPAGVEAPPICLVNLQFVDKNGITIVSQPMVADFTRCAENITPTEADIHDTATAPSPTEADMHGTATAPSPMEADIHGIATAPSDVPAPSLCSEKLNPAEANGYNASGSAGFQTSHVCSKILNVAEADAHCPAPVPVVLKAQPPWPMNLNPADANGSGTATAPVDVHVSSAYTENLKSAKANVVGSAPVPESVQAPPPCPDYLKPTEANLQNTATAPAVVQPPLYLPKSHNPKEDNGHGSAAAAPAVVRPLPQPPSGMDVETPIVFSDAERERGVERSTRKHVCGGSGVKAGNNRTKTGGVGPVVAVDGVDGHGANEGELKRVPASSQSSVAVASVQKEDRAKKLSPACGSISPSTSCCSSSSVSALSSVSVEANDTRPAPSEALPVASHGMCGGTLGGAERRVVSEIPVPFSRADGEGVSVQQRVDGGVVASAVEGSYREEHVRLRNAANKGAGSSSHRDESSGKASTSPGEGGINGLAAVENSESETKRTISQSLRNEPALIVELARFEETQRRELSEEKRQCREELAPLEAELEALKQRLRVRMWDAIDRQARELEIYRAALFGASAANAATDSDSLG